MIWKSFNKITFSNYSSSLLESPDSLDTPDSHDDDDKEHDGSSILSLMDQLQLMLRSFPGLSLSQVFSFIMRYFLTELLRIYSFSCSFLVFLFPAIKIRYSMVSLAMVSCWSVSIVEYIFRWTIWRRHRHCHLC